MPISEEVMWRAAVDTRLGRIEGAIRCLVRADWQAADLALQGAHCETEGRVPEPETERLVGLTASADMTHDEAVATIKTYAKRLSRFFETSAHAPDAGDQPSVAMVVMVPGATFGDYDPLFEALRTLRREL